MWDSVLSCEPGCSNGSHGGPGGPPGHPCPPRIQHGLTTDATRFHDRWMAEPRALTEAGVSDREAEVLRLVGAHLSNAQIANRLVISVRTVESHVSSLLRKLDVASRKELAQLAASYADGSGLPGEAPEAAAIAATPRRRSGTRSSDDLNIAYQVTGAGDVDLVLVAGFVSHLTLDWTERRHAHFLHRLGTFSRLIRFDKRGHRDVGPARLVARPRDADGRRGGGDGGREVRAGGALRVLRGRPDVDPLRGQLPRAGARPRHLLQLCAAGSGPRTTRGGSAPRSGPGTPCSSSRTGPGRPTCAACARTPTRSSPGGGGSAAARPPARGRRVPSSRWPRWSTCATCSAPSRHRRSCCTVATTSTLTSRRGATSPSASPAPDSSSSRAPTTSSRVDPDQILDPVEEFVRGLESVDTVRDVAHDPARLPPR